MTPDDLHDISHRPELAAAIHAGERGLEFRAPRERSHALDLVVVRVDAQGTVQRTPIGLRRRDVAAVVVALQCILLAADKPAPGSPPPSLPRRHHGGGDGARRRPGEPPASWVAMLETTGTGGPHA